MLRIAQHIKAETGMRNLCIAGGVGLNSVANDKIAKSGVFDNVWIQPAASDAGIPLGCALHGYYQLAGGTRKWHMTNAYLGKEYDNQEIISALMSFGDAIAFDEDASYRRMANLLSEGKIVGLFTGSSEYGPRALGHRSILMDPRKAENKDILNARVKFREAFRPFAPAVLEEFAHEYFDLEYPSPFMLLVAKATEKAKKTIPAVVHTDGTGRVQTVTQRENGSYYDVIRAFHQLTGVPVLLNTSFNIAGEPIVETPTDAIRTFIKTNIDYLVMEGFMVSKAK